MIKHEAATTKNSKKFEPRRARRSTKKVKKPVTTKLTKKHEDQKEKNHEAETTKGKDG